MTKVARPNSRPPPGVERFRRQRSGETVKNADGSTTKRRETARGSRELTTRNGKLLETTTEFRKTTTNRRGTTSDGSFTANTDLLGRRSTERRAASTNARGDTTSRTTSADVFGNERQVRERSTTRTRGDTTTTATRTSSSDLRGNRAQSSDITRVTDNGRSVVTRNEQRAQGTERTTGASATYQDGQFRLSQGVDRQTNNSFSRSYESSRPVDVSPITTRADKTGPIIGRIFTTLGIEHHSESTVSPDRVRDATLFQNDHATVATRVGITGGQSATIDANGLRGTFNRTAEATISADAQGSTRGRHGEASYTAHAAATASASVDAEGRIDASGLNARVSVGARAAVEVEVTGRAQTNDMHIGGVPVHAAVDGRARASAEVSAQATGTVAIVRNPPVVILQGEAGASAVAKAEAEGTISAGPFSVRGSAYASAGAEARASGVIGYQNGHLRIGGSLGAALGVGAGASVGVDVNVRQIGQIAHGVADVNQDGRLGLDDVAAAGRGAARLAANTASNVTLAAATVTRAASRVAKFLGFWA